MYVCIRICSVNVTLHGSRGSTPSHLLRFLIIMAAHYLAPVEEELGNETRQFEQQQVEFHDDNDVNSLSQIDKIGARPHTMHNSLSSLESRDIIRPGRIILGTSSWLVKLIS